jgi:beta-glucosidase
VEWDGDTLVVSVRVTNDGNRAGDGVVQVYLCADEDEGSPRHWLAAFVRVHLALGESHDVVLSLRGDQFALVDADGTRSLYASVYSLFVGGGQPGFNSDRLMQNIKLPAPLGRS